MNSPKQWFLILLRIDWQEGYTLWFSGEGDGFEVVGGKVPTWRSANTALEYAAKQGYTVASEKPPIYALDQLMERVTSTWTLADRQSTLDAWNLFSDLATTVGNQAFLTLDRESQDVYNHLFYLCDAAPVRGTQAEPLSTDELDQLRKVVAAGLNLTREHFGKMQPA
ncbi:MAG: hypothetical protein IPK82_06000 [Polyangiaceae bacterium]|nr:hypothetical protein [Polyangiaceae bacterium]